MTDSENSGVRIKALLNELDRLQYEIRKKKLLIRVIASTVVFGTFAAIVFLYNLSNYNASDTIHVKRGSDVVVKDKPLVLPKIKSYQLVFENFSHYPLARFFTYKEALVLQEEIKNFDLPATHIEVDSLSSRERVLAISSNYRYYIQFGIFKHKLISHLPEDLIYLHQINDKGCYKYRLGPFTRSTQAKDLVKVLNLKDYLIIEVCN